MVTLIRIDCAECVRTFNYLSDADPATLPSHCPECGRNLYYTETDEYWIHPWGEEYISKELLSEE